MTVNELYNGIWIVGWILYAISFHMKISLEKKTVW